MSFSHFSSPPPIDEPGTIKVISHRWEFLFIFICHPSPIRSKQSKVPDLGSLECSAFLVPYCVGLEFIIIKLLHFPISEPSPFKGAIYGRRRKTRLLIFLIHLASVGIRGYQTRQSQQASNESSGCPGGGGGGVSKWTGRRYIWYQLFFLLPSEDLDVCISESKQVKLFRFFSPIEQGKLLCHTFRKPGRRAAPQQLIIICWALLQRWAIDRVVVMISLSAVWCFSLM